MADYTPLSSVRPDAGDNISRTTFFDILDADFTHIHDLHARYITNNTGGSVSRGYVGVLSTAATDSLLSTTSAGDTRVVAVVLDPTIASGAQGYVALMGLVGTVAVQGAVARGDTLQTYTSVGLAQTGGAGGFARALSVNASGTGTVAALIHNRGATGAAGHTIKDGSTSYTQRSGLKFTTGFTVTDDSGGDNTVVTTSTSATAPWSKILTFR